MIMHHKVQAQHNTHMLLVSLFLVRYNCYKLFGRGGDTKMLVYYNQ